MWGNKTEPSFSFIFQRNQKFEKFFSFPHFKAPGGIYTHEGLMLCFNLFKTLLYFPWDGLFLMERRERDAVWGTCCWEKGEINEFYILLCSFFAFLGSFFYPVLLLCCLRERSSRLVEWGAVSFESDFPSTFYVLPCLSRSAFSE